MRLRRTREAEPELVTSDPGVDVWEGLPMVAAPPLVIRAARADVALHGEVAQVA